MDLARAIGFPFDDEDWPVKTLIGSLMMLLSFLPFVPLGYQMHVARNVAHGRKRPLPGAPEIGQVLSDGVMTFIAAIVYALPLVAVGCLLSGFGAMLGDSDVGGLLMLCLTLCLSAFLFPYLLIALGMFSMGAIRFAQTGDFVVFLQARRLWDDMRAHMATVLTLLAYLLVVTVLGALILAAVTITCLGIPVVIFLGHIIAGHLVGQAALEVGEAY